MGIIINATIEIDEQRAALLQDLADEAGTSREEYCSKRLNEGANLVSLANDRAQQIYWSLASAGKIPAEVLAESRARAKASA